MRNGTRPQLWRQRREPSTFEASFRVYVCMCFERDPLHTLASHIGIVTESPLFTFRVEADPLWERPFRWTIREGFRVHLRSPQSFTNWREAKKEAKAGSACLDTVQRNLNGFLPGYAERGALRFCCGVGRVMADQSSGKSRGLRSGGRLGKYRPPNCRCSISPASATPPGAYYSPALTDPLFDNFP